MIQIHVFIYLFFRERGWEGETGRETLVASLSHTPRWGTEPATEVCVLTGDQAGDLSLRNNAQPTEPCQPGQTSSSLERLKSFWILLALLGPRQQGIIISVRSGISFFPFFTNDLVENTENSIHNATLHRFVPLPPVLLGL